MYSEVKSVLLNKDRMKKAAVLFLYVFAAGCLFVTLMRCRDNAFWGDEGFSIRLAKRSIPYIIKRTAKDVHPPLYYFLLKALYMIGGSNGFILHLSAYIPYAMIVLTACTFVRKRFGEIAAIILVILATLSKGAVIYNVEVRMYSLAAFFVLSAFLEVYEILKKNRIRNWVLFVIFSLGAAYTHYYALVSVAFFYAALLLRMFADRRLIKPALIASAATIAGYIPWMSILITQFRTTTDDWWLEEITSFKDIMQFVYPYNWFGYLNAAVIILFFAYSLGVIKLTAVFKEDGFNNDYIIHFGSENGLRNSIEMIWVLSGIASLFGTIAVGMVLSYTMRPSFLTRFVFPVCDVIYLIFGFCLSKLNFKRIWAFVFIIVFLTVSIPEFLETYKEDRKLEHESAESIEMMKPEKDALMLTDSSHINWTLLEYYYPDNEHGRETDPSKITDRENSDIWLIWTSSLDEYIEQIKSNGYNVEKVHEGRFSNGAYCYYYHIVKNNDSQENSIGEEK